jgi:hypothetical protein
MFLNKKGRRKMLRLDSIVKWFCIGGMCGALVVIFVSACQAEPEPQPALPIDKAVQQVDQTLGVFWTVVDNIPMTGTQRRALEQPTKNLMKAMEDLKKSQEDVSKKLVSLETPKEEGAK